MNDNSPLVTVNILSFNRKDELRNTLTKVYEQDYKNIEVIVVDNASSDGSAEMVGNEFPKVILVRMLNNIGIAGWNEGFKIAKGEYVLVLDDDSYPEIFSIANALSCFVSDNVGITACNIYNPSLQNYETLNFPDYPLYFIGCGAVIKKETLRKIGYYNPMYFIFNHELDFSIRCYAGGFVIKYARNSIVRHDKTASNKNYKYEKFRYKFNFITYLIFLTENFMGLNLYISYFRWLINRIIVCFYYGFYREYLYGLFEFFKIYPAIKKRKLSTELMNKYNFGKMSFIDKEYFGDY